MNPLMLLGGAKDMLSKLPWWVYLVAALLGAYWFNLFGIKDKFKAWGAASATKSYQNQSVTIMNDETSKNPPLSINLQQIANDIYGCFHGGFFKWVEDEDRAINLLKSVPVAYRSQLAILYAQKGENMYDDFRKYLRDDQYAKVESYLR